MTLLSKMLRRRTARSYNFMMQGKSKKKYHTGATKKRHGGMSHSQWRNAKKLVRF
jgi:flagellar biosynthesis chaperone FliJ